MRDGQREVGHQAVFAGVVEQACEDYGALVEKGILIAGDFVRDKNGDAIWKERDPKDKSNIATTYKTTNDVCQLLNWMTDGSMQNCLDMGSLRNNAHHILRTLGFESVHYKKVIS